ncbi:hypothetical protein C8R44DRAFT_899794 [Mycena epipterygia]|nr:hypothetical protein C8R44DRAFT_899794 [Mycena epipterygia]
MASLWKLPFLFVDALFYHRSYTQPTIPASQDEQKRTDSTAHPSDDWFENRIIPILPAWNKLMFWAFTVTETSAILTSYFAVKESSDNIAESNPSRGRITAVFLLGTGLIVAGATIRIRCFREMGRHFTFALSLRDDHTLITSGGNMTILGAGLTLMSDGSWWFGGGRATLWGRFLAVNFIACSILDGRVFLRAGKEDAYLKKAFGEQWVQFAKKVPYMYIPGLCCGVRVEYFPATDYYITYLRERHRKTRSELIYLDEITSSWKPQPGWIYRFDSLQPTLRFRVK